jgi:hypothetical protein
MSEPITFHDLPKARQVSALQAYSESFRKMGAVGVTRGGKSSRQLRRAAAKQARRK